MIECPFCWEWIDENLSTCIYCWNLLDNSVSIDSSFGESDRNKMWFILWLVFIVIIFVVFFIWSMSWIFSSNRKVAENNDKIQSLSDSIYAEYCVNNSWTFNIGVDDEWNVFWACNLLDGTTCDLVEYFRWDCLSSGDGDELCSDESGCEDGTEIEESSDFNTWINEINSITWNIDDLLWDWTWYEDLFDYYNEEFSDDLEDWDGRTLIDGEISGENENDQKNICISFWWIFSDWKCMLSDWNMLAF